MMAKWDTLQLEEGKGKCFALGNLSVHLLRQEKLLLLEPVRGETHSTQLKLDETATLPSYAKQIACGKDKLLLRPILPERPLVVRLHSPIQVNESNPVKAYVVIPAQVAFSFNSFNYASIIYEESIVPFSQTWLGMQDKGELAWSYTSSLLFDIPGGLSDYDIVVPVRLQTNSSAYLEVSKFVLRTSFLSIYSSGDGILFSDQQTLVLEDGQTEKEVQIAKGGVDKQIALKLLTSARNPNKKNIIANSFSFLKSIYQL